MRILLKKFGMQLKQKKKYLISFSLLLVLFLLLFYQKSSPGPLLLTESESPTSGSSSEGTSAESKTEITEDPTDVPKNNTYKFDVVIYGGTPSGIMAAIAASEEGAEVAVVEPGSHIGGMITGGLGFTDTGNTKVIGGLAKEFFRRIGQYYGNSVSYYFEPHAAEKVLLEMVREAGVSVYYNNRLKESGGVWKSGTKIISIVTEKELTFFAHVFVDSSYEGDLMALAGVSYTYGREGNKQFNESLAGVRPFVKAHNFKYDLSAYSTDGELFQGISTEPASEIGQGDTKIPAYNFRLCLTDDPGNQVSFVKPANYDPSQYELLAQWLNILKKEENNRNLAATDIFYMGRLPANKVDTNNSGPFSSNFIGQSWKYPLADYKLREAIISQHKEYLQGLLYFLVSDEQVPYELRADMSKWGFARDEFTDNSNWPYQLYIREGRRMTSDFVMTQVDLQSDALKYDSIGMGSYSIDSHHTQRVVTESGLVKNEGDVQIRIEPYQLPYRIILPKENEAENLMVTVCMSASHIAYSSIRTEPQYMILGQAAGIAAKLAIDQNCSVQNADSEKLRLKLKAAGAVIELYN